MAEYISGPDKEALYADLACDDANEIPMEPKFVTSNPVNHPSHYNNGDIECIDALRSMTTSMVGFVAFCAANAVKYIWRHCLKGKPIEDLKKARWYIDRLISFYELKEAKRGKHE
mgnify:CR=1 FL=1